MFQGDVANTATQLAKVFGEIFDEKYFKKETNTMQVAYSTAVKYVMDAAPAPVPESFKAACANVLSEAHRNKVEAAYRFSA